MKLVKLSVLITLFCVICLFMTGIATALDEWVFVDIEPNANVSLKKV